MNNNCSLAGYNYARGTQHHSQAPLPSAYILILIDVYYMHNNTNYHGWNKALTFGVDSIQLSFRTIVFTQYIFNPNVNAFQSNCAEGLHFSAFHSVCVSVCVCFPYSGTSRNQAYKQQYQRLQRDTGMKYKNGFFFKTLRSEVMASFTHLE